MSAKLRRGFLLRSSACVFLTPAMCATSRPSSHTLRGKEVVNSLFTDACVGLLSLLGKIFHESRGRNLFQCWRSTMAPTGAATPRKMSVHGKEKDLLSPAAVKTHTHTQPHSTTHDTTTQHHHTLTHPAVLHTPTRTHAAAAAAATTTTTTTTTTFHAPPHTSITLHHQTAPSHTTHATHHLRHHRHH